MVIGSQCDTLGAADSMALPPHSLACGKDGLTGHVAGDKLHSPTACLPAVRPLRT